jgi:flagellar biosynthetic protein FliQ
LDTVGFQLLIAMLKVGLWVAVPVLAAVVIAGVASGLFQGSTAVSDPSLSTVPRLVCGAAALILCGPWMMRQLVDFTIALFYDLGRFAR